MVMLLLLQLLERKLEGNREESMMRWSPLRALHHFVRRNMALSERIERQKSIK